MLLLIRVHFVSVLAGLLFVASSQKILKKKQGSLFQLILPENEEDSQSSPFVDIWLDLSLGPYFVSDFAFIASSVSLLVQATSNTPFDSLCGLRYSER